MLMIRPYMAIPSARPTNIMDLPIISGFSATAAIAADPTMATAIPAARAETLVDIAAARRAIPQAESGALPVCAVSSAMASSVS